MSRRVRPLRIMAAVIFISAGSLVAEFWMIGDRNETPPAAATPQENYPGPVFLRPHPCQSARPSCVEIRGYDPIRTMPEQIAK